MKFTEYTYKSRNDFKGIFVCEFCDKEEEKWGYEDDNFHRNVIPKMKCNSCGKCSNDSAVSQGLKEFDKIFGA